MASSDFELKKLHAVQLAMLRECIRICDRHGVRHFLLGGSALGAVRHSGFIPWDDDIDIGIPRADYERFLAVAPPELSRDLFLQTHETDPEYPLPYAKVRNSRTTFIESSVSHLRMNHGVYIDVFPLDGFPERPITGRALALMFRAYRAAILHKLGIRRRSAILHPFVLALAWTVSLRRLRGTFDRMLASRPFDGSVNVVNWNGAWGLKEAMQRDVFGEGTRIAFEDVTVTVPADYDRYLTLLYGDYMTPPPLEKRTSHHPTAVVDLERPYSAHMKTSEK